MKERIEFLPEKPLKADVLMEYEQLKDEIDSFEDLIYKWITNDEKIDSMFIQLHNIRNRLLDLQEFILKI